jgi:hypothetical protein
MQFSAKGKNALSEALDLAQLIRSRNSGSGDPMNIQNLTTRLIDELETSQRGIST